MILKMKKKIKFLNLCGLSTESFLAIWPSQYKFLINEILIKKICVFKNFKMRHFPEAFFLRYTDNEAEKRF